MKNSDIRELSLSELFKNELELRRGLWKARFDNHSNQLDNTASIRHMRRNIARIKTEISSRNRKKVIKAPQA